MPKAVGTFAVVATLVWAAFGVWYGLDRATTEVYRGGQLFAVVTGTASLQGMIDDMVDDATSGNNP